MNRRIKIFIVLTVLLSLVLGARDSHRTSGLRHKIYEQLEAIQVLAENDQLVEAHEALKTLQNKKLSSYELSQSWFLVGYVYYRQENYPQAIEAYEKVLEAEDIPSGMIENVLRTLSQLCTVLEQYPRALAFVNQLFSVSNKVLPDHYILRAQVLYQLDRLDEALVDINTALKLQHKQQKKPRENWFLLKNAIYYRKGNYKGMLHVLRQLVRHYPRDRYLLNMAAIYGELEQTEKQLALMEPLYERGSLKNASQLLNLASLYMLHQIPYKAANLLDTQLDKGVIEASERNYEMLAQAWMMASELERALEPYQNAAELAEDGENYLILSRVYMSLARWPEAERMIVKALEKGEIKDEGNAQLLLGMSRFNQKKFRAARRSFTKAGRFPKTEKLSKQWLNYLAHEEERLSLSIVSY